MCKLNEIQEYLSNLSITNDRIQECFNKISNPCISVNSDDKKWVACNTDHEINTVYKAINEILENKYTQSIINTAISNTCNQFKKATHKPRIVFYVLVIDKLID